MRFEKRELQSLVEENLATFDKLKEAAQVLKTRIEDFANDREIFAGQAAEAVGGYLIETHVQVLGKWIACFEAIKTKLVNFLQDIEAIDSGYDFVIETDYVEDIVKELRKNRNAFAEIDQEAKDFVRQYHEFLDHDAPSMDRLLEALDDGIATAERVLIEIDAVDYKYKNLNDEVEYLLYEIEKVCKGNNFLQIEPNIGILNYSLKDLPDNFKVRDMPVKRETDAPLKISDNDGDIDFEKLQKKLRENNLSEAEINELAQLVLSDKVKYEDISKMFEFSFESKDIADNIKENLARITDKCTLLTMDLGDSMLNTGKHSDKAKLQSMLVKTQLLAFMRTVEVSKQKYDAATFAYRFSTQDNTYFYFFPEGTFDFSEADKGRLYFLPETGGHYIPENKLKQEIRIVTETVVLNKGSLYDFIDMMADRIMQLSDPPKENDIALLKLALGIVLKAYKLDGVKTCIDMIFKLGDICDQLSDAEKAYGDLKYAQQIMMQKDLIKNIYKLGGYVIFMSTDDSFEVIGYSFEANKSVIKIEGLKRLNIEPPINDIDDALIVLSNLEDPNYQIVNDFLMKDVNLDFYTADEYNYELKNIYSSNFSDFVNDQPELEENLFPATLSKETLNEVIAMYNKEHPDKQNPVKSKGN